MKKYKLVKEYPGSPKLGTIVEKHDPYYHGKKRGFVYTLDYIEKSPEFWEEVIGKDYEILTYYCKSLGLVAESIVFKEPQFGGNSEWNIHSVKRLSDGEIFTIGDNTTLGLITQIHLDDKKGLWLDFNRLGGYSSENYKNLRKVKVLLTTEDGVDIFEGDKLYTVNKKTIQLYSNGAYASISTTKHNDYVYFSRKEKAMEYILMNKPCLSLNDLAKWEEKFRGDQTFLGSNMFARFRELAKLKM